ncbi:MAG: hypothetical protein ACERKO_07105 [Acetanaerobacterium sp.]
MGHSTFATTADIYSYLDFSAQIESGVVMDGTYDRHDEAATDTKSEKKEKGLQHSRVLQALSGIIVEKRFLLSSWNYSRFNRQIGICSSPVMLS